MTIKNQTTTAALADQLTGFVTVRDGAKIGYHQMGHGPGLVLLHGAMETALSHLQLAEALAGSFTVTLPDRRGRGLSGPYNPGYGVEDTVEDMEILLEKTDAHFVFGVSSGALIWLKAALSLSTIHKAVLFEPPLFLNPLEADAILTRYDREMAQGKVTAALVTGLLGAQMGPPVFQKMPRWLLELLTNSMTRRQEKQAGPDEATMRRLAPTLHDDFQLATELSRQIESFGDVRAEVLLLGGSQSPQYLKTALDTLETILPRVKRIELTGLNHNASGNADTGGQPEQVAQVLRQFFA